MKKYGLIGFPLSHSFSKKYFARKFQTEKIGDCVYDNYPIETIDAFPELIHSNPELQGLNVTIPYKEKVIPYLTNASPVVNTIRACNCIRIQNGELTGHNTDVAGFSFILNRQLNPKHKRALVLGTGGASKAVNYVLDIQNIERISVSRNPAPGVITYDDLTEEIVKEHLLIINTSPVGMYPGIGDAPSIPYSAITGNHLCVDLIYNPAKTKFLQLAEEKGSAIQNGEEMLVVQAEESWKIWNS
ncbi:shikimate dehydrogenase [Pollutibacter soli]|uniref:shikimate dehydrogenase family protein n=1 Tax=Pollutibacter soli TaxID=3034157 RepID=UPI0030140902